MNNATMLHLRFPFEDSGKPPLARIKQFELLFYNIFHLLVANTASISVEIVQIHGAINFYIICPRPLVNAVMAFLFALFPDTHIQEVDQYIDIANVPPQAVGLKVRLVGSEAVHLRSAETFSEDPLNVLFNTFAQVSSHDAIFYQLILSPIDESMVAEEGSMYSIVEKEVREDEKPHFQATVRMLYFTDGSEDPEITTSTLQHVFSPLATEQKYLRVNVFPDTQTLVNDYFSHAQRSSGMVNTEELALLFHAPDPVSKIRGVNWVYSRKAEPPMNLPTLKNTSPAELSRFGVTNFRGTAVEFGIKRVDRRRHLYIVGKSGVGKSKLLEKLIINDIVAGKGVCVIDPHGDLIQALLYHVPKERTEDVVYFSPSDLEFPIAFNPIANVSRDLKQQVAQGMIEIFKKFFGADWSPKIEHVFRFTILALLDYHKATIMGMQQMLTDRSYRQAVIAEIQDHVVKKFWANEFSSWSEKFDNEAIVPLVNKLGQFLSNEMVRNIVAQQMNKVDFDDIMNNQRILLVELSKGKLGEENSALLGSLIITKIEQHIMARALVSADERKDFYLYVDEFQNFATKTFDNILSEARKYRLNLTVSHQYLGQLLPATRETVFGNVGSMITFRLGAEDAQYVANEFAPRFSAYDIMNLGVREMYLKISIDGVVTPAFSAMSADVADPDFKSGIAEQCIAASRRKYATPLGDVEAEIAGPAPKPATKSAAQPVVKSAVPAESVPTASVVPPPVADDTADQTFEAPLV
ncbi:MAG: type IV secretory system conjugative DNA transfer family protein [Candidatus Kerfeldbacteria bacterium]|nr:type IV secretory system conjugative DNA transfer family protein [Candidatus Kerfeldbacteria bacterium]